jgi:hypothetical protein
MSYLGSLVRVSPQRLDELRSPGSEAYKVLCEHETQIDLDKSWDGLRFLLDAVGVPVNPMRSGRPYPSAELAWGYDGNSCLLTVEEVRQVWHFLETKPFRDIAIHLPAATEAQLYPGRQWDEPSTREMIECQYEELAELFRDAAAAGECTVFWAA